MSRVCTPAADSPSTSTAPVTSSCWQTVTYLLRLSCMRGPHVRRSRIHTDEQVSHRSQGSPQAGSLNYRFVVSDVGAELLVLEALLVVGLLVVVVVEVLDALGHVTVEAEASVLEDEDPVTHCAH